MSLSQLQLCQVAGIAAWAVSTALAQTSRAQEAIDGFLVPYRAVDVATAETGILRRVLVREGDAVQAGQELAQLDDEVHAAAMAEAEQSVRSEGRLQAARAELELRKTRLDALEQLLSRGSARPEEVDRARADCEIARSQLRTAQDDMEMKRLEFDRAKRMFQRRKIKAPCNGVVVKLFKEEGEFIGPSDPQLMTVMQLDPLLANFAVSSAIARQMRAGQPVRIQLRESATMVDGVVRLVSPVIDGRSGTMRVEVKIENPAAKYLSGESCTLLPSPSPSPAPTEKPLGKRSPGPATDSQVPTPAGGG